MKKKSFLKYLKEKGIPSKGRYDNNVVKFTNLLSGRINLYKVVKIDDEYFVDLHKSYTLPFCQDQVVTPKEDK